MSKVVSAIYASDTSERRIKHQKLSPIFTNVFNMKEQVCDDGVAHIQKQYKIEVTLGARYDITGPNGEKK